MTRDEARHVAEILTAWADGETIQYRTKGHARWYDDPNDETWSSLRVFEEFEFRIKPKPREWWLSADGHGEYVFAHDCEATAARHSGLGNLPPVHVREVIE